MHLPARTKCYFVSDLHLLANRSNAARYTVAIRAAATKADAFVLGGDIFDFRWAREECPHRPVEEAADWLRSLAVEFPRCEFHFVLGNHDYHQGFIERLDALEDEVANLTWHPYYLRLGRSVFLHGDVADGRLTPEALSVRRARALHGHRRRGWLPNLCYDLVVAARLHKPLPYLIYPRRRVARRILAYLEKIGHGPAAGVRNVYFGHTHRNLAHYRYGGLVFHNGGAPIKGLRFRILRAETRDEFAQVG